MQPPRAAGQLCCLPLHAQQAHASCTSSCGPQIEKCCLASSGLPARACAGQRTSCLMCLDVCVQAFLAPGILIWRRQHWARQRSSSSRSARPRLGTSARRPAPSCGMPALRCSRTCTDGRGRLLLISAAASACSGALSICTEEVALSRWLQLRSQPDANSLLRTSA